MSICFWLMKNINLRRNGIAIKENTLNYNKIEDYFCIYVKKKLLINEFLKSWKIEKNHKFYQALFSVVSLRENDVVSLATNFPNERSASPANTVVDAASSEMAERDGRHRRVPSILLCSGQRGAWRLTLREIVVVVVVRACVSIAVEEVDDSFRSAGDER